MKSKPLKDIAHNLVEQAKAGGTKDNTTLMIIELKD